MGESFIRISVLLWADILVGFALFVMQNYLTDVWKLSFTHAAGILNIWNGINMILPVFFLFLVDVVLGNFGMLLISSIAYSLGIGFVAMSTPPVLANSTGTCKEYEPKCIGHTQKTLFYTGMALIVVGMAGNLVSVRPFLEEQKKPSEDGDLDEQNPPSGNGDIDEQKKQAERDRARKASSPLRDFLKLPTFTVMVIIPIAGAIALPYINPWTLRFGIPAICTAVATFLFLTGLCWLPYEKREPRGSPITNIFRVFVASVSKICQSYPRNANLYLKDDQGPQSFRQTRFLRCLEKAAITKDGTTKEEQQQARTRWRLCSISEVEEAKIAVRMIPMWLTFIICGIVSSFGNTYFVEQANHLDRHIGKWNVPIQALLLFSQWSKSLLSTAASCLVKKHTTYGPAFGIGTAMVFSILCCITAARTEQRRLHTIGKHNLWDKPEDDIPMSIYWLLFQFFLLAGLDSYFEKSVKAFYDYQSPDSMKPYLMYLSKAVFGLGFIFNVLSVYVVGKISEKGGKRNWFQFSLNNSRLDRYYWVLATLSAVNLLVFAVVACCYRYKNLEAGSDEGGDVEIDAVPSGEAEEKQYCSFCC
ncbi:protein NRT1/ PTR FAMILY 5.5-like [Andrographis paniculata]|uniref:protein NRT1/ PTR FAMILY 5.5-like n=1 Tax=Andrographis paniculata TaxID=175694 RepID=UPI0021E99A89|nr:protein NRT1/ PTR FAMILY 5.5-like [Andrographis paniculata]